ncbi:MAG TPA: ferritin-like domain-containing protein [Methylocella sp.]|nr:ferritin-like domain-containing protein [Methylocella sp.]
MIDESILAAASRRNFMSEGGKLSVLAVALLVGSEKMAKGASPSPSDLGILNTALGLEYEGIAAYQVGAESKLLKPAILKVAVQFQSDHKKHAEALANTIVKLGGSPVSAKKTAEYDFPTHKLKTEADVLKFAAGLEQGAVSAYLGAVPAFEDRDLAKVAASILGNEAQHVSLLLNALGQNPDPSPFMT